MGQPIQTHPCPWGCQTHQALAHLLPVFISQPDPPNWSYYHLHQCPGWFHSKSPYLGTKTDVPEIRAKITQGTGSNSPYSPPSITAIAVIVSCQNNPFGLLSSNLLYGECQVTHKRKQIVTPIFHPKVKVIHLNIGLYLQPTTMWVLHGLFH